MVSKIFLMIIGFFLLVKGADFVVKGASSIAKKFHLSQILIGIVIVGIGTSLPEIIVTIEATKVGTQDIIIGNSIGSCICNLLLVTGITSVCSPLKIDDEVLKVHLPVSVLVTMIFFIFCNFGTGNYIVNRTEALILLALAIIYIMYTAFEEKGEMEDDQNSEQSGVLKVFLYLIFGIIGLKFGADFVIDGAVEIAVFFGISQSVISMTVVALGTSLPEIVTGVVATLKKESDLAIGNVIGSNIFNICLLPGIGALLNPINYDTEFNRSLIFLLFVTVYFLVFDLYRNRRIISKNHGVIFILMFCLYMTCLLLV